MLSLFVKPDVKSVKEVLVGRALVICIVGWSDVFLWNPKLTFGYKAFVIRISPKVVL